MRWGVEESFDHDLRPALETARIFPQLLEFDKLPEAPAELGDFANPDVFYTATFAGAQLPTEHQADVYLADQIRVIIQQADEGQVWRGWFAQ